MKLLKKWIAFDPDKRWLRLLRDDNLQYIIDRALDGDITKFGEQLLLMPDRREGKPDVCGVYKIGAIKKSECLTLKQLVRKIRKSERVTDKSKKPKFTPSNINTLEVETTPILSAPCQGIQATETPTERLSERRSRNACSACKKPFHGKRSDAKFCSSRCRQKHYRNDA